MMKKRQVAEMDRDITLPEVLDARERRVLRQNELMEKYGKPVISFTMNIAGPRKNSPLIRRGYGWGCRLLRGQLLRLKAHVLWQEEICEPTGNEALFVVDAQAETLKKMTCALEDDTPLGRLFDMDVLSPGGIKLDRESLGLPSRPCLICGGDGRACARSRTHTVPQLQERTRQILEEGTAALAAGRLAELAVRSLLYEVCTTPKPGLVDMAGSGSHRDMDVFTFMRSCAALWPCFERCARIGMAGGTPQDTFAALRRPGMLGEGDMLLATGGVNTHKGAIFSLGILCAALGRLPVECWNQPERVLAECAAMTEGLVERELAALEDTQELTVGQRLFVQHGITGVRGQMEQGLPAVREAGLPTLKRLVEEGHAPEEAGCAALLAIMLHAADTNLIARGGLSAAEWVRGRIEPLLRGGGCPSRRELEELDRDFVERNLSPGGSADLLAVSYYLYFLEQEAFS